MSKEPRKPVGDDDAALVPTSEAGSLVKYGDDAFAVAAKVGDYLPRLQLMTSNSDQCKEAKFPINHYAIVRGKELQDVGEAVDLLVVTWRPKALEMGESIVAIYDHTSEEFKRIMAKSEEQNSGCMYGPEYLVYIPSIEQWATFFMGSKSARNEAGTMRTRIGKAATLKAQKLANKKFTWFSPQVNQCSTPFEMPDISIIKEQAEKFNNPPETEIEVDDSKDTRER